MKFRSVYYYLFYRLNFLRAFWRIFLNWLCYLGLLTYIDFRFSGMRRLRLLTARQFNEFSHKNLFSFLFFSWWNIFRSVYYLFYRLNFLRDSSNSCLRPALIHSYSPVLESNVPFWIDLSRRVNLGPSSRSLHFSAFLNSYLQKISKLFIHYR